MSVKSKSRSISFITLTIFHFRFSSRTVEFRVKSDVKISPDDNITIGFNIEVVKNFCYFEKKQTWSLVSFVAYILAKTKFKI